jgi:Arc/MetJ-type ribon-helix-helix transcriptional regulator
MSADAAETRPFAIQLEVEFLDRLSEPVREGKAKSVSEIIRAALARFDLSRVVVVRPSHVTISVRLPAAVRKALRKALRAAAKAKHTSVGQLVRSAVESYLPAIESGDADQLEMPIPHVEMPEEPAAPVPAAPERTAGRAAKKKTAAKKPKGAAKAKPAKAPSRKKTAPAPAPMPTAKRVAKKSAPKRAKR